MKRKPKENKPQKGRSLLLLAALLLIFYAVYHLYDFCQPYFSGEEKYQELRELAGAGEEGSGSLAGREAGKAPAGREEEDSRKTGGTEKDGNSSGSSRTPADFDALEEINADIVGWIRFEEPAGIDYPVVQGRDNQEYLTRTFDGDGHKYGTIFVDADNRPDFSDRNTFIYGHHMANGSMFAGLLFYLEKGYYDAHPYFTIETVDGRVLSYQVCSVEVTAEGTLSYRWQYESEASWEEYLSYIMNNGEYKTGVELRAEDRLVSLSTCLNTTTSQRVLLHGVLTGES